MHENTRQLILSEKSWQEVKLWMKEFLAMGLIRGGEGILEALTN